MRGTHRKSILLSCLALLPLCGPPGASAWEWVYGPAFTEDRAARGVTPVPACGTYGPGYVTVGTHDAASPDPDVYVVFTDALGGTAPGWERTYDIWGSGQVDEGVDIVPVPGAGYVFLANTWNGVWRPALAFINCSGAMVWSRIYYDTIAGYDLRAKDLIRTQSGDAAFGTAAGDFAVAGVWWTGGNDDGFLMRTDATGALIWNVAHNTNYPEAFHALAEALPWGTATTGDLVAVGRWNDYLGEQDALVARVDGNTGMIGPLPQCLQRHGQAGSAESYNAVIRLQNVYPGEFAMLGTSSDPAWLDDMWLTRGNPCTLASQVRYGDHLGVPASEHGNDLIEILVPKPAGGFLAIAGDTGPAGGGPYEGALVEIGPLSAVRLGSGRRFGGIDQETFTSLAEDPVGWPVAPLGYILAGSTRTQFVPDPQDLYLAHFNPAVVVCEKRWSPVFTHTTYPQTSMPSAPVVLAQNVSLPIVPFAPLVSGVRVCSP